MGRASTWLYVALGSFLPGVVAAAEVTVTPSTYQAAITALAPGDVLVLEPGDYPGLILQDRHGEEGRPIVIRGRPGAVVHYGGTGYSAVGIRNSSWLVVQDLEIDLLGAGAQALQAEDGTSVHHVIVERLWIHGFEDNQQRVGISTKCPAWDWIIRDNVIEGAGTGMYLGDSDGTDPFIRGLVEHNLVIDPIGYDLQIKHQAPRPSPPGIPTGDNVTIIRHNVLIKATNASLLDDARPNLLVGHWPLSGPGQDDRYEIYGNFLYQNSSAQEALFQGEGNFAFYANVLINTFGPGIYVAPHNDLPKAITIFRNTIYTAGRGIQVTGADPSFQQLVLANVVISPDPIVATVAMENVTADLAQASTLFVAPGGALGSDFYPLPGALEGAAFEPADLSRLTDGDLDFNGQTYDPRLRGAYGGAGVNPGWDLAAEPKPRPTPITGDAGSVDVSPADAAIDAASDAGAVTTPDAGPDAGASDAGFAAPEAEGCGCTAHRSGSGSLESVWLGILFLRRRRR